MTTTTIAPPRLELREYDASGYVTSQDGTRIGYSQVGHGPGVVLVHGAMEWTDSHLELAAALADRFCVTVYDRRGRGRSGPPGPRYAAAAEVADLEALLTQTGAQQVFGVSAGGLIALEAALALPAIRKIALFEPALVINGVPSVAFTQRLDQELAQGKTAAALVTGMKGAQMGPAFFNALPRWLMEQMTQRMLAAEDKSAQPGDVTMRQLAPTLHSDFQLVAASDQPLERYRAVRAQVLLLGGSASPAYLRAGLSALAQIFPQARRVVFPGLGHGASGNRKLGGRPDLVAGELRQFFE